MILKPDSTRFFTSILLFIGCTVCQCNGYCHGWFIAVAPCDVNLRCSVLMICALNHDPVKVFWNILLIKQIVDVGCHFSKTFKHFTWLWMPDGDNIGLRCKMGRNESYSKGCNEQRLSLLINLVISFGLLGKMSKKCETQLPKVHSDVVRLPKVQIKCLIVISHLRSWN